METNFEIIRYRPEHKEQVLELGIDLWSCDRSLRAAYFEWKYERNPYVKKPLIYLAVFNGKVVGMRGFHGVRWECGIPARTCVGLYADDMVVASEHRQRGLMAKIMTGAFEDLVGKGYDYVFNLSAGLPTLMSSLSMGWRSAGWVGPMLRRSKFTDLRRLILPYMRKLPIFSNAIDLVASLRPKHSLETVRFTRTNDVAKRGPPISIVDNPRCQDMADLVSRIGSDGRIRHVLDSEYFQWRFQNPLSRYRYVYCGENHLQGYLVVQEYTSEGAYRNLLNIVHWEAIDLTI